MTEDKPTSRIIIDDAEQVPQTGRPQGWNAIWERIIRLGLGEVALRAGTGLALLVLVLLVAWVMGNSSRNATATPMQQAALAAPLPTATLAPTAEPIKLTPFTVNKQTDRHHPAGGFAYHPAHPPAFRSHRI